MKCPYCKETVNAGATRCPHCTSVFDKPTAGKSQEEAQHKQNAAGVLVCIGIAAGFYAGVTISAGAGVFFFLLSLFMAGLMFGNPPSKKW